MKATGRHLLAEYHGCDREVLNDLHRIEALMTEAAVAAEATVVGKVFHPFTPQGVSGVVVVEESHLSIHTWPEHGYAAVDFFTCGECHPERAHDVLKEGLRASGSETMFVKRGMLSDPQTMQVLSHEKEDSGDAQCSSERLGNVVPYRRAVNSDDPTCTCTARR